MCRTAGRIAWRTSWTRCTAQSDGRLRGCAFLSEWHGLSQSAGDLLTRASGLRLPITGDALDKYLEDVAIDATRIQRVLGFAPAIDLDTGWRDTMAAIRRAES